MNRKMVSHFLSRIHTFPDQEFCCLAEYLPSSKRYVITICVCSVQKIISKYYIIIFNNIINQGYKDDYSICGAYLFLAYAGQRKLDIIFIYIYIFLY